jgi:hypothetical protein
MTRMVRNWTSLAASAAVVGALDKFTAGEKEKGDLLGALGPMKTDIVEK